MLCLLMFNNNIVMYYIFQFFFNKDKQNRKYISATYMKVEAKMRLTYSVYSVITITIIISFMSKSIVQISINNNVNFKCMSNIRPRLYNS